MAENAELVEVKEYNLTTLSSSSEEGQVGSPQVVSCNVNQEMHVTGVNVNQDLEGQGVEKAQGRSLEVMKQLVEKNEELTEVDLVDDNFDSWLDELLSVSTEVPETEKRSDEENLKPESFSDVSQNVDQLSGSVKSLTLDDCPKSLKNEQESVALKTHKDLENLLSDIIELKIISGNNRGLKERLIKSRLTQAYERIKAVPASTHLILQEEVKEYHRLILATQRVWVNVKRMLELFDPDVAERLAMEPKEAREEARILYVDHLVSNFEGNIKKATRKLDKLEDADVDLNDHSSSAFLTYGALLDKCKEWFEIICLLRGANDVIGQSYLNPIRLNQQNLSTGIETVDMAIENFLNRNLRKGSPDFESLYKIIQQNLSLNDDVNESETFVFNLTNQVFKQVEKIFRDRRRVELEKSLAHFCRAETVNEAYLDKLDSTDPGETDAVLKEKLAKNLTMRKSEKEVIDHYVTRAKLETENKKMECKKRKRLQLIEQGTVEKCDVFNAEIVSKKTKISEDSEDRININTGDVH